MNVILSSKNNPCQLGNWLVFRPSSVEFAAKQTWVAALRSWKRSLANSLRQSLHILRDGRDWKSWYLRAAAAMCKEIGRIVIFHQLQASPTINLYISLVGTRNISDVVQGVICRRRSQFLFKSRMLKDDHIIININITLLWKYSSKRSRGKLAKVALSQDQFATCEAGIV